MSRLYDRVLSTGWRPLTAEDLHNVAVVLAEREEAEAEAAEAEFAALEPAADEIRRMKDRLRSSTSSEMLGLSEIEDAVVVSAEEVADYFATIPSGTNTTDILASVVPPFDRTFVEFQRRTNSLNIESWGVLFNGTRVDDGWHIEAVLVGEWRKGEPVAPILRWHFPIDGDGMLHPTDEQGHGAIFGYTVEIPTVPREAAESFGEMFIDLLAPALLAISLMHCKNVDVRLVDPPERLSAKHRRKHGRPLTRYHVLDIKPMRRVLDSEGEATSKGLRHALHICRGHFKTYTEDAPLFGRHTGTYWWESQARGKAEQGVVEKDYRIRLDQGLGREYAAADEQADPSTASEHSGIDPDLGGRGLRAHNVTQNLLAEAVRSAGHEPRRPRPDEPQYDLAWEAGDATWVAEVKSLTPQNEERQLRMALGQVLRYCQLLEDERGRAARAMIVTEVQPTDASWLDLCEREGIAVAWGPEITIG